ncbi:MAG: PBP1A family penicillin-binding protein [Patescibacteria group bacterium]|nr:PBP1A family penicillin-binding protein [Patescibacteria group bacterium]MDD5490943.1 PBP1A family penicillin-binding protein [Patescibacteria group bacterium]
MALPHHIQSPKSWKRPSYERFKKPNRTHLKPLPRNKPLGIILFKKMREILRSKAAGFSPRKNLWNNFWKGAVSVIVLGILVGSVFFVGVLAWFNKDLPDPNKIIERSLAQSTKIYDRTGEHLLYEIHGDAKRTVIKLNELPEYVKWATIDIEDKNFYKHGGFSLWAIFRTTVSNILFDKKAGGSTITQQFIKNAILTNEKTYTRKIKELILAYQIEKKFSKDEILQMYFNEIPYGSTVYGIQSAAQNFFGKDAKDLTLAEAALLAALPQRPTYLSPHGNHTDELFSRQKYILDLMVKYGHLEEKEAAKAKEEKITFKNKAENITAPHFVMYVKELLTDKYGEKSVAEGGLKVYTTLDWDKQKNAEEAVTNGIKKIEQYGGNNAALVSLDAPTGQILAMVGSRDYFDNEHDGQVNVTLSPRQPGSSFKPIVYAAAFEKGYTPNTVLYDVNTVFKTEIKDYEPKNYDLKEHGPVTIRQALAGSLNIPAVKTIYLAGIDKVLDLAEKMGYTTLKDRSRFGLSLVLGGGEVRLLEHTAAYAVFANEGVYFEPSAILKVEDRTGKILEEFSKKSRDVLDKNIAQEITSILSDNNARTFIFGAENLLHLEDRPVAAKTGTTNDYHDAWTVGYTPDLATGVWVGNNNNKEMKRGADGSVIAAPIWQAYMKKTLMGTEVKKFNDPEIPKTGKAVLDGENFGQIKVNIDKASGKLATEYTPPSQIEEKIFQEAHCLLYYIRKDDPLGPPPDNPADDPQYQNWEEAVQKWAAAQGFITQPPPTEYDDVHLPRYQPVINITSHNINETVSTRDIVITVQTSAPRGMRRVEYFIDNKLMTKVYSLPFTLNYHLKNVSNGFHTIKAVAYDDVDNNNSAEITLNFNLPTEAITINWIGPKDNSTFYASSFPLTLSAELSLLANVAKVDFYYEDANGNPQRIDSLIRPASEILEAHWVKPPAAGKYKLYMEVTDELDNKYQSEYINVTIQ